MSKMNIIDELRARGLVKQTVFEDDLKKLLDSGCSPFISVSIRRRTACMSDISCNS